MCGSESLWYEGLHRKSQQFGPPVSESSFNLRIHVRDSSVFVSDDDRVRREFKEVFEQSLGRFNLLGSLGWWVVHLASYAYAQLPRVDPSVAASPCRDLRPTQETTGASIRFYGFRSSALTLPPLSECQCAVPLAPNAASG